MYASSAWSRFVNKQDWQRIDEFLRRSKKCGFCPPDLPSFQELRDAADELLFDKILFNKNHLLCCLLPPPSAASQTYNLRRRSHSQLLPQHPGHLMDSNFITRIRMLYKDIYWRQSINILQLIVALLSIISLYLYFFNLSYCRILISLRFDKLLKLTNILLPVLLIGKDFHERCAALVIDNKDIRYVSELKYLGVHVVTAHHLKLSVEHVKVKFIRRLIAFMLSRVHCTANSEMVTVDYWNHTAVISCFTVLRLCHYLLRMLGATKVK